MGFNVLAAAGSVLEGTRAYINNIQIQINQTLASTFSNTLPVTICIQSIYW